MIRTTVYLEETDKRRLAQLAASSGVSEAELIRRGVRMIVAEVERPRPHVGYARSTDGRRGRDSEEHLTETGFGT